MKQKTITTNKMLKSMMAANNIFYIIELNKFTEKEMKQIFNKVLKMKHDKQKGDFF